MRQCGNPHAGGNHLNQQQGIIHTFQYRVDAGWLQKMPPDIHALALYRINHQHLFA